ncbi:hypothetical protein [Nostoc sp. UHCC 0252]|jgi:hypothetical protein|uniref:hypothetical protein n=1 Tax=unclassified Nostoc TaxID=2593658 RepID=UPI002B1F329B|nr:hypothetical protein [Nostoc sp. UHCC 0252]MEA5605805.1 hypothetical protein [Nostoc sp. UHCC 0252]
MTNRERPKSALKGRMGSSATFARQLFDAAKGNFWNIQPRTRVLQLETVLPKELQGENR